MRYIFIFNLFLLFLSSCKQNCAGIQCSECPPPESTSTTIFEFDSTQFDSILVYNNPSSADTSYTLIALSSIGYKLSYGRFNYNKMVATHDRSRHWKIGEVAFIKTKGEDCCDCGTEKIDRITINDSSYSKAQLPLRIK